MDSFRRIKYLQCLQGEVLSNRVLSSLAMTAEAFYDNVCISAKGESENVSDHLK